MHVKTVVNDTLLVLSIPDSEASQFFGTLLIDRRVASGQRRAWGSGDYRRAIADGRRGRSGMSHGRRVEDHKAHVDRRVASGQRRGVGPGKDIGMYRRSVYTTMWGRRTGDEDAHRDRRIINTIIHRERRSTDKPADRRSTTKFTYDDMTLTYRRRHGMPMRRKLDERRAISSRHRNYYSSPDLRINALERRDTPTKDLHDFCQENIAATAAKVAHAAMTAENADVAARVAGLRDYAASFVGKTPRS